jgi:hypothetical protein
MAGWAVGLAALLCISAACGSSSPVPAQAVPPSSRPGSSSAGQVSSILACLDAPRWKPVPSDSVTAQVEEITTRIEAIRGHRFSKDLDPTFVTDQEMRQRIVAMMDNEYPVHRADADQRILVALGAVPADIALRARLTELLAGQTAGFYDTETEELVVAARDPNAPLGLLAQSTLAHELDHALVDAVLGIPEETLEGPSDAALAMSALVEGDAVLAQERFLLTAIPPGQRLELADNPEVLQAVAQLQSFPYILRAQLLFPYDQGAVFVCDLYAQGGWPAVNAAYREPPTTSAQILFPQRYATREGAVNPRDPGVVGGAWKRAWTDTIGAAELLWLFQAPGDNPQASIDDPLGAAGAWAGGEVHLWVNGPTSAVGVALVDRAGNGTLCAAVARWYDAAFLHDRAAERRSGETLASDGPTQDAVLRCEGRQVRLGIAPDLATARALTA